VGFCSCWANLAFSILVFSTSSSSSSTMTLSRTAAELFFSILYSRSSSSYLLGSHLGFWGILFATYYSYYFFYSCFCCTCTTLSEMSSDFSAACFYAYWLLCAFAGGSCIGGSLIGNFSATTGLCYYYYY
jgi:hypothetical protein